MTDFEQFFQCSVCKTLVLKKKISICSMCGKTTELPAWMVIEKEEAE